MNRTRLPTLDTLITILLILAGILLAVTLFGAGVFWRSKTHVGAEIPNTRSGFSTKRTLTNQSDLRIIYSPVRFSERALDFMQSG
jgi:hypothetical protein